MIKLFIGLLHSTFVINSYKTIYFGVIIAGGGGGGAGVGGVGRSGGGGAGLVLVDSMTYNLSPGAATYPVTVGSGGAGKQPTNPLMRMDNKDKHLLFQEYVVPYLLLFHCILLRIIPTPLETIKMVVLGLKRIEQLG